MQIRHHDVPHHRQLLLRALRRALRASPVNAQHHRGLLAKDQNPHRELPNEIEKDRLLSNQIQDHLAPPEERVHHQSLHIQLPRKSGSDETETRLHSGLKVRIEEERILRANRIPKQSFMHQIGHPYRERGLWQKS